MQTRKYVTKEQFDCTHVRNMCSTGEQVCCLANSRTTLNGKKGVFIRENYGPDMISLLRTHDVPSEHLAVVTVHGTARPNSAAKWSARETSYDCSMLFFFDTRRSFVEFRTELAAFWLSQHCFDTSALAYCDRFVQSSSSARCQCLFDDCAGSRHRLEKLRQRMGVHKKNIQRLEPPPNTCCFTSPSNDMLVVSTFSQQTQQLYERIACNPFGLNCEKTNHEPHTDDNDSSNRCKKHAPVAKQEETEEEVGTDTSDSECETESEYETDSDCSTDNELDADAGGDESRVELEPVVETSVGSMDGNEKIIEALLCQWLVCDERTSVPVGALTHTDVEGMDKETLEVVSALCDQMENPKLVEKIVGTSGTNKSDENSTDKHKSTSIRSTQTEPLQPAQVPNTQDNGVVDRRQITGKCSRKAKRHCKACLACRQLPLHTSITTGSINVKQVLKTYANSEHSSGLCCKDIKVLITEMTDIVSENINKNVARIKKLFGDVMPEMEEVFDEYVEKIRISLKTGQTRENMQAAGRQCIEKLSSFVTHLATLNADLVDKALDESTRLLTRIGEQLAASYKNMAALDAIVDLKAPKSACQSQRRDDCQCLLELYLRKRCTLQIDVNMIALPNNPSYRDFGDSIWRIHSPLMRDISVRDFVHNTPTNRAVSRLHKQLATKGLLLNTDNYDELVYECELLRKLMFVQFGKFTCQRNFVSPKSVSQFMTNISGVTAAQVACENGVDECVANKKVAVYRFQLTNDNCTQHRFTKLVTRTKNSAKNKNRDMFVQHGKIMDSRLRDYDSVLDLSVRAFATPPLLTPPMRLKECDFEETDAVEAYRVPESLSEIALNRGLIVRRESWRKYECWLPQALKVLMNVADKQTLDSIDLYARNILEASGDDRRILSTECESALIRELQYESNRRMVMARVSGGVMNDIDTTADIRCAVVFVATILAVILQYDELVAAVRSGAIRKLERQRTEELVKRNTPPKPPAPLPAPAPAVVVKAHIPCKPKRKPSVDKKQKLVKPIPAQPESVENPAPKNNDGVGVQKHTTPNKSVVNDVAKVPSFMTDGVTTKLVVVDSDSDKLLISEQESEETELRETLSAVMKRLVGFNFFKLDPMLVGADFVIKSSLPIDCQ